MKKMLKRIGVVMSVICVVFTLYIGFVIGTHETGPLSKGRLPETEEKAVKATVDYFKEEKNVDVVITNTGFSGELMASEFYVEGHVANDEQQKFSATVDCYNDYKVEITSNRPE